MSAIHKAGSIGLMTLTFLAYACLAKDVPVKLTGASEVPATQSAATGTGTLSVGEDHSIKGSVTTQGMSGTMAHVHVAPPGKNGPPIITLSKSGDDTWAIPEGSKLTDEQYRKFKAGELYVNVHSEAHPGGEIRAQLKP